jgi:nitrate reductase gamma subunit
MNSVYGLVGVLLLLLLVFVGVGGANLHFLFGAIIPYIAVTLFIVGIVYRVLKWACSPVPFRIPTTSGQQKSLPWIKASKLDNPSSTAGVIGRMALEVLLFRSLFKNTKAILKKGPKLVYGSSQWLWLGALAFHWSFLYIFIRHYRYFAEPIPGIILQMQSLDGFFQIGVPVIYLSNLIILAALSFLFIRRIINQQVKYISLPADFFPLFLLLGIVISGILMRHFYKVDVVEVKNLAMGLLSFNPVVSDTIGIMFFIHLFFVSVLIGYFPFSKLLHMPGIFMSPTRNLANNNRMKRHVNPWDYPVKVHTYDEWEDEFRDKMKAAGLPVEKE